MGSDYELVRVERRIGKQPKRRGVAVRSFGSQLEIAKRLEALAQSRLRPRAQLRGDPVRAIAIDHAAPWSLLPIADCLKHLGPFAIYDPNDRTWHDPSTFRPKPPRPLEPPFAITNDGAKAGVRWSASATRAFSTEAQLHAYGSRLLVTDHGGYATLIDAATGKTRWAVACGRGYLESILSGSTLVVGSEHPHLFGIAVRDGSLRWRLSVKGAVRTPLVRIDSRRVALATLEGCVHAVDVRSGRRLWTVGVEEWVPALCSDGGLVIAGTARGELIAVENTTGRVRRRHVEPRQPVQSPMVQSLICSGGKLFARLENEIQLLDPQDLGLARSIPRPRSGSSMWMLPLGDTLIDCTPGPDGEWLTAVLDAKSLRERFSLRSVRPAWVPPILVDETSAAALVIGSEPGTTELRIMNWRSGRIRSSRALPVESPRAMIMTSRGFVVAADERLIALS